MTTPLLDICDSNLQLWCGAEPLRSPGYALLEGNQYRFGNPARATARLHPRQVNTRFWWQLNTEPLQPALGPARHTADMVHAHLLQLHREAGGPEELVLAVPGSMQHDQLALLLGIIQQCPFDAVGLVNRSVILGSLYASQERLFHLELQLHQAVLSELVRTDDTVALGNTTALPGCGVLALQEKLAQTIATAFVRQTRFDPRRKADTEQQLYDDLPRALRTLQDLPEINIEVGGYRARITRGELESAGERLFPEVLRLLDDSGQLLLDPIAALLPGLKQRLPQGRILPTDAIWQAAQEHGEHLVQRQAALNFMTALPCLAASVAADAAPVYQAERAPQPAATHLLEQGVARPLDRDGDSISLGADQELYPAGEHWRLRGPGAAEVNGEPYREGRDLLPGDQLQLGDRCLTLIEVRP